MEVITTFKGSVNDIKNYKSIILAIEDFSIGNDHTFSKIEVEYILNKAKSLNVKVNVLVNKMIFDNEIKALEKTLSWLKDLEVDGIFFADMAVFMLGKKLDIKHLLIFAPGMTIVNSEDVREYLALGIQSIELANEITLEEKIKIANNNPKQVGVVISGYMLMSYSKRLALSNYFNEINKNQAITNNYNLSLIEATRENKMPIYQDSEGTYIYSEYILDSFKFIKDLMESKFKYFRIDGIFLDEKMILDIYKTYTESINNLEKDYSQVIIDKYPEYNFDNIFYTTKTSEVK